MVWDELKKCCETCETPDIQVENTDIPDMEHGGFRTVDVKIYCRHAVVCMKYNKEENG